MCSNDEWTNLVWMDFRQNLKYVKSEYIKGFFKSLNKQGFSGMYKFLKIKLFWNTEIKENINMQSSPQAVSGRKGGTACCLPFIIFLNSTLFFLHKK